MKFTIYNEQTVVAIDEEIWNRAFNYAVKELQVEYHRAAVTCFFIPFRDRMIKVKPFTSGGTVLTEQGALFYIVAAKTFTDGRMVKTFFHEMAHVRQLLMGDLIQKPRHTRWKGEKWDKKEYSFAPWEKEAEAFSVKAYDRFLRLEVTTLMADESVHAYHPSMSKLYRIFPQDDVFGVTQEMHRQRESKAKSLKTSSTDMSTSESQRPTTMN